MKIVWLGVGWFLISLLMVAFYPFHKFIYSLTIPLIGISMILATLTLKLLKFSRLFFVLTIVVYMMGQFLAVEYAKQTHWSIKRAILVKAAYLYLDQKFSQMPDNSVFYVRDTILPICQEQVYPLSRELDHALMGDLGLKLKYGSDKAIFYEYNTSIEKLPLDKNLYTIDINAIFKLGRSLGGNF